jgi:hypothetical protein
MANPLENEAAFEDRVMNYLSDDSRLIIRKNTATRRGFVGRRKPDLVTIERNLLIVVWELKSPLECNGNDQEGHIWLRHPQPSSDYLTTRRNRHASNTIISAKVRGWCVVVDAELRYWLETHNQPQAWRLPFEYNPVLINAAVAAPASEACAIKEALDHLRLATCWNFLTHNDLVIARGVLDGPTSPN